jgi:hypothetical protein
MGDVDDLGSANLAKVQDVKITNRHPSPFWENFTWRFAESRYSPTETPVVGCKFMFVT